VAGLDLALIVAALLAVMAARSLRRREQGVRIAKSSSIGLEISGAGNA
jgi:hypothetical protein